MKIDHESLLNHYLKVYQCPLTTYSRQRTICSPRAVTEVVQVQTVGGQEDSEGASLLQKVKALHIFSFVFTRMAFYEII